MSAASRWEWLDFDESESKKVRDFLTQDVEGEGVDPLRIGASVRDRIAEKLFPGTSTQYTRLRYVFLVPAILRKKGATIGNLSQIQTGLNLTLARANPKETGIIGKRTPDRDFVHLYWTAVGTWKLLTTFTEDERDLTVTNGLAAMQSRSAADEEGNTLSMQRVRWNPEVVILADKFWAEQQSEGWPSIRCSKAEVDFVLGEWQKLPNEPPLAAIASRISKGQRQSRVDYPWDIVLGRNTGANAELNCAKTVSLICWSAQLAYNFALLKAARTLEAAGSETTWKLRNQDLAKTEAIINDQFKNWKSAIEREKASVAPWASPSYWNDLGSEVSRDFLAKVADMLVAGKADLKAESWFALVKEREKVNPAPKLSNAHHLSGWSGTPEMAKRWDFRWKSCVRRFVQDAENPRD